MINPDVKGRLLDNLRICTIRDHNDVERIIRFNEVIWGEEENKEYGKIVGNMVRGLITQHPYTSFNDFLFIENGETGEVLSFLCSVPLKWKYGSINLKVSIIECVGTLKPFRRKGFIKALMKKYDEQLKEEGYDLSIVWGIPYFYRQFGYEYALPYREECILRFDQIPDGKCSDVNIRPMTIKDIPYASRLLNLSLEKYFVHTVREECIWLYQEKRRMSTEHPIESFIVESKGAISGYFRLVKDPHPLASKNICILEASDLTYDEALEVLRYAKSLGEARNKIPAIRIFLPTNSPLTEVAKFLGGQFSTPIKYLIKIPDVIRFLTKIKPVLEERIEQSVFRGLTTTLKINLFKLGVKLCFADGILKNIEPYDPLNDDGHVDTAKINPSAFYRLLVGDSSIEEISACYPDVVAYGKIRHLLSVLFPKTISYFPSGY